MYDIFFSYKRDPESNTWHRNLKEKLAYWLKQELGQAEVRIFFDTDEIRTGLHWRQKIADALRSSRAIICVWSPLYFQSPWCVSEWKTFEAREGLYHLDLVIPASYHDGESFPIEAKARQWVDFSNYTSTFARFWETESAVQFEDRYLKRFARDTATRIRNAPPFDPNFPLVEAMEHEVAPPQDIGRPADV